MLGKLIKYNNKSIVRIMLPLYLILFITTISTKLLMLLNTDILVFKIISGLSIMIYVCALLMICIGGLISVLVHFYRTTICDQAYFTFTLPATIDQHLQANTIVGCLWIAASFLLSIASLLVVGSGFIRNQGGLGHLLHLAFDDAIAEMNISYGVFISFLIISIVIVLILQVNVYQLCFAAGQCFRGHKLIGSFAVYMITYFVMEFIMLIPLLFYYLFNREDLNSLKNFGPLAIIYLLIYAVFAVVAYFVARYFFTRRFNLE